MVELNKDKSTESLPFNNLYLISGLVNGQNKGWMYIFTLLFLVLGYLIFQSIIFFPLLDLLKQNGFDETDIIQNNNLIFDSNALKLDKNWVLLLELGMFVFAFICFFIGIKFVHKKSFTSVLTGYQTFRYKRFGFSFMVWAIFLIISVLLTYIFSPDDLIFNFNLQGVLISTFIMIILMPIQTGIEEIVFRGYLIQGLSQILKNGIIPLIFTSLLFGLAHMSNPEVEKFGWPIMLSYYVCFALFMGCITLLDEGLELAFGIHFANNLVSSILISSPSSVIKTYSLFDVKSENALMEIILWFGMALITFFIFLKKYRWKNFHLIIK